MTGKALVVDDSLAMRRIQSRALESLGWQVETAADGQKALDALASMDGCRLVLTDWHMPGMDGIELIKAVRQDPRYAKLVIVMVTSDGVLDSVELALNAGADDFVMKPLSPGTLGERLAEIMEN